MKNENNTTSNNNPLALVVGAGISGATVARVLADNGYFVTVIDKRETIGGNLYDYKDENGIIVQQYGPHIFHTNEKMVFDFLSRFTIWYKYEHKVLANVNGILVPVPFNLTSLELLFPKDKADKIKNTLLTEVGYGKKIPILTLKAHTDPLIREFADFVYENIFKFYTMKQWGLKPEYLNESVTARVPVYTSYENKYFTDEYQFQPSGGFTEMVKNILDHKNIKVLSGVNSADVIKIFEDKIYLSGKEFLGQVIYTGKLDELFNYEYGALSYRSLDFVFETHDTSSYQQSAVVNYTTSENFTRISEFTKFTCFPKNKTVIVKEYSKPCSLSDVPYYPFDTPECKNAYIRYLEKSKNIKNLHLLGRLANYKYINIDIAVLDAINKANSIIENKKEI